MSSNLQYFVVWFRAFLMCHLETSENLEGMFPRGLINGVCGMESEPP